MTLVYLHGLIITKFTLTDANVRGFVFNIVSVLSYALN